MNEDYPVSESYTDCAGVKHEFVFTYRHLENLRMYAVDAEEIAESLNRSLKC